MNTKEKLLEYIKQKRTVNSKKLTEHFGISRQAIHKHLKEFIQQRYKKPQLNNIRKGGSWKDFPNQEDTKRHIWG